MSLTRSAHRKANRAHTRSPRARRGQQKQIELRISGQLQFQWAASISESEWQIYRTAIETIRAAEIPFMLGGGFALASFTGRWRDTKDIDFYIKPGDRQRAVDALVAAGFDDYFQRLPYDRKWIYRSVRSDVIVDMIWSMANQRAQVDDIWFERAGQVSLRNQHLAVVPREEFMWCKLYILQRDHCDWTDLFNLIYASGELIDWDHLIERLEEDAALLRAMLTVYGWLCPREILKLPQYLWDRLGMPAPEALQHEPCRDRIRLLDSRAWFAALKQPGEKLEV